VPRQPRWINSNKRCWNEPGPLRYKREMGARVPARLLLTLTLLCLSSQAEDLKLVVIEGEGALNNIRTRRAKEPVVRVEDATGEPVRGAAVNFILPAHGASGSFGGELSLTVTTGPDGLAAGRGLKPNRVAGPFEIRVSGSLHGETAGVAIHQVNVEPAAAGGNGKKFALAALIGGAAIGGVLAATHGGKSTAAASAVPGNAAAPTPGGAIIVPGTPGFGPPR
jgi:hypothetical protein